MEFLKDSTTLQHLISSSILLLIIWFIKTIITRSIRSSGLSTEVKRRWIIQVRNSATVLILLGIGVIWAVELQTFALSLVAIAAAIVIGTKELILCFLGGLLKASTHPFVIGDRIEIDGIRGDVIDSNFMTTRLLEIGPGNMTHQYTGRSISFPNSLFLTKSVVNESYMQKYVLHVFTVPFKRTDDWKCVKELMLKAAEEECASFIDEARTHMERLGKREGLEVPSVDPRISINFPKSDEFELVVRIPAPSNRKGRVEQAVLHRFLEVHGQEKK